MSWGLAAPLAASFLLAARAEVVVLTPVADTTLVEAAPTNNLGGMPFVNAGTTQTFTRNRGLFRFDLDGQVPPGASVTRAEFSVEVVGKPRDGFAPAPFGLHRLLQSWGEGDKSAADPGLPGLGAAATIGEATWAHRFASREDAGRAPLLRIEFDPPPRIEHALVVGSSLVLQFTARAGQVYVVESRDRFTAGTPWLELTNVPAPTVTTYVTVIDLGPPAERFYRLRLP
jgi:hypothetical protein